MKHYFTIIILALAYGLSAQVFHSPKSVAYSPVNKLYYISNICIGSDGGSIVALNPETQEISSFIEDGLISPKGLVIVENVLYCTSINLVIGYNLSNGKEVFSTSLPKSSFLVDITSDDVNLFVRDMLADKIYKINIISGRYVDLEMGSKLQKPNAILYDKTENRLLIASYRANSPIQSFDFSFNILSQITETNISQIDGITVDANNNYYVSSWTSNAVYMFDADFINEPIEISNGHYSPSDIFINIDDNELVIPNNSSNIVDLVSLETNIVGDNINPYNLKIYPIPSNGVFTISFLLDEQKEVSVCIMNKRGRVIHVIKKEIVSTETQEINFDSRNFGLTRGVYFLKFVFGDDIIVKRIVIID